MDTKIIRFAARWRGPLRCELCPDDQPPICQISPENFGKVRLSADQHAVDSHGAKREALRLIEADTETIQNGSVLRFALLESNGWEVTIGVTRDEIKFDGDSSPIREAGYRMRDLGLRGDTATRGGRNHGERR